MGSGFVDGKGTVKTPGKCVTKEMIKKKVYCVNTYSQTGPPNDRKSRLYVSIMNAQAGRSPCAFARWRVVLPS